VNGAMPDYVCRDLLGSAVEMRSMIGPAEGRDYFRVEEEYLQEISTVQIVAGDGRLFYDELSDYRHRLNIVLLRKIVPVLAAYPFGKYLKPFLEIAFRDPAQEILDHGASKSTASLSATSPKTP